MDEFSETNDQFLLFLREFISWVCIVFALSWSYVVFRSSLKLHALFSSNNVGECHFGFFYEEWFNRLMFAIVLSIGIMLSPL